MMGRRWATLEAITMVPAVFMMSMLSCATSGGGSPEVFSKARYFSDLAVSSYVSDLYQIPTALCFSDSP